MCEVRPNYGVVVPLITPLREDFSIDKASLARLTCNVLQHGALPFVLGTTGEYPSLSLRQKEVMVKAMVESVSGIKL